MTNPPPAPEPAAAAEVPTDSAEFASADSRLPGPGSPVLTGASPSARICAPPGPTVSWRSW
ncbi:hypothetical protein IFE09_04040 [Streptomyces microflavus]|nr:hypothetical protein IFE09_04040 [Streptomyces microflavus]